MYNLGNPGVFFFVSLKEIDSGVFVWFRIMRKGRQETKTLPHTHKYFKAHVASL